MADNRPLREKLLAMAAQTNSPEEAQIASAILLRLSRVSAVGTETPQALTRSAILAAPDSSRPSQRAFRVRMPKGTWLLLDEDQVPWDLVKAQHLTIKPLFSDDPPLSD
jgi:hypothetical protein